MAADKQAVRINTRQRVLALLTSVVNERCGVSRKSLIKQVIPHWGHQTWNRFIKGEVGLPDRNAKLLEDYLKRTIKQTAKNDPAHPVLRDLCYLRSRIFSEIGTEYLDLTGCDDQYQLDRELLFALDIERKHQQPDAVQRRAHGFWYVIRFSTHGDRASSGDPAFCVSLLSVNSNAYMRHMGENDKKRKVPVITSLPHFSLRTAKFQNEGAGQELIRGQIVQSFEPKAALNFLGTHEGDSPALFLMTLKLNERKAHATEAYGVTLTTNAQTMICGPVAACSVPLSPEIVQKAEELSAAELRTNAQLSLLYREQRRRLKAHLGRYSEEELMQVIAPLCENDSVRNAARRLKVARDESLAGVFAGFYYVTNP